jgi:uncharacterized membrane protein YeaQ/YmgE (transglycosylase-associated protein family)
VGWGTVTAGTLNLRSIGVATLGAIVVLLIARVAMKKRRD